MRKEGDMTLLEHLEDLRKMLIRISAAIVFGMVVVAPFTPQVLGILTLPLREIGLDPSEFLINLKVMSGFSVAMTLIFWTGLLLATPFIVFFVAQFVFPALHKNEKRIVKFSSVFAVLLFFLGAALGFFGTTGLALQALITGLNDWLGIRMDRVETPDYIVFVVKLVLGFGLAFELPLVLLMLGYAGLVNTQTLCKFRRHVVVGLLILAMMLTPPEPISQIVMASALYFFYEICILMLRRHEKKTAV
jgi:sec-independent protein translocase protein TatC